MPIDVLGPHVLGFLKSERTRAQRWPSLAFFGTGERINEYVGTLHEVMDAQSDSAMLAKIQRLLSLAIQARIDLSPPVRGAALRAWSERNRQLQSLWRQIDRAIATRTSADDIVALDVRPFLLGPLRRQAEQLYVDLESRYGLDANAGTHAIELASEATGIEEREDAGDDVFVVERAAVASSIEPEETAEDTNPARQKTINAWIVGHVPGTPLATGRAHVLNLQVGAARGANLTPSHAAAIDDSDLPAAGLATQWVVIGIGFELQAVAPTVRVESVTLDGKLSWSAHFDLHIPKRGESEARGLLLTAHDTGAHALEVLVYATRGARRELYRRFRLELDVGVAAAVSAGATESLPFASERILAPAGELLLRTPREWTTPPGRLSLTIFPSSQIAFVQGDLTAGQSYTGTIPWTVAPNRLGGLCDNVRNAAESFRGRWDAYLNQPSEADVDAALGSIRNGGPAWNWEMLQFAPEPAGSAWPQVSASAELAALAIHGYALFDALFPKGSALREPLVALGPGHRIDVMLAEAGAVGIGGIPWNMLYLQPVPPRQPVDPMWFTGLRWRVAFRPRNAGAVSKALGTRAATFGVHLLYSGRGNPNDATANESSAFRRRLAQWPNQRAVPAQDVPDAPAIWSTLDTPPEPTALVYLYCQCAIGQGNTPTLQFGPMRQPSDELNHTLIAQLKGSKLADQPLVFANACTTAAADPNWASELEENFFDRGCRAYIGTETKVPIPFANRFAGVFFPFFFGEIDNALLGAGESLTLTRLFFWNFFRNIGGLFYTYLNEYEVFLADQKDVVQRYGG